MWDNFLVDTIIGASPNAVASDFYTVTWIDFGCILVLDRHSLVLGQTSAALLESIREQNHPNMQDRTLYPVRVPYSGVSPPAAVVVRLH